MMPALRIVFCMLFLLGVWAASVAGFVVYTTSYALDDTMNADGIIVLTGGSHRVDYGLELLAEGRGRALFISGVSKEVPLADLIQKAPATTRDMLAIISLGRITLGRAATNTIGNAEESVAWIKDRGYESVLLVTADYHLPRALIEFKELMPANLSVIPAPVRTKGLGDFSWVADAETRNRILAEFHKLVAAKLRHMLLKNSGPE